MGTHLRQKDGRISTRNDNAKIPKPDYHVIKDELINHNSSKIVNSGLFFLKLHARDE